MEAGTAGFAGFVLLLIGFAHLDDVTPSHVRIGWAALGFAALLFVLAHGARHLRAASERRRLND